MSVLRIVLVIRDEDVVREYRDVHPDLVLEDLIHGSLAGFCEVESVREEER